MSDSVPVYQSELEEIACVNCGAPLRIRGMGRSSVIGCEYCGAVNGLSGDQLKLLAAGEKLTGSLLLPLGIRGAFENTVFEVIGCLTRSDPSGQYEWREYLLMNPYRGYRWLVEQNGHWLYVTSDPKLSGEVGSILGASSIPYLGDDYKRFDSGVSVVRQVVGEFYWQVAVGERCVSTDYISPPFMLSFEKSEDEIIGSHGVYLTPNELDKAFDGKTRYLPWPSGVAPAQPNIARAHSRIVGACFVFILIIITFFQIIFVSSASSKLLFAGEFDNAEIVTGSPNSSAKQVERMSAPFRVDNGLTNLRVDVSAPVDNSWVSVFVTLINEKGDVVGEKELEVSYYYGRDSDGAWSEGSRKNNIFFERVPNGTYVVNTVASTNIKPKLLLSNSRNFSSANRSYRPKYELRVFSNVPYWGNYLFVLFMTCIYPCYLFLSSAHFEAKRRQNSTELSGE